MFQDGLDFLHIAGKFFSSELASEISLWAHPKAPQELRILRMSLGISGGLNLDLRSWEGPELLSAQLPGGTVVLK